MKTKREIVERLVENYEFHVRMNLRCDKWADKEEDPREAERFRTSGHSHFCNAIEFEMILDELGIPRRSQSEIRAELLTIISICTSEATTLER